MSCFFCDSFYHLSQNCDIFVTDENRQLIAKSKGYCNCCLNILDENHGQWLCNSKKRCYQCFSKNHHTAFCQNTASPLFVPCIDADLFSRFIQLFDPVERVTLAVLSSKILNVLPPTQFGGIGELDFSINPSNIYDKRMTYLAYNKIIVTKSLPDLSTFRSFIINRAKIIVFKHIYVYSTDLFKLLTSYTLELTCINVNFKEKINFSYILSKTPNLKKFDMNYSSSIISQKWPENLLKTDYLPKLKLFKLSILFLDFNVNALAAFMKKTQADVVLRVNGFSNSNVSCKMLEEMFKTNFILQESANHEKPKIPHLTIEYRSHSFLFLLLE